jgi:hypothetical protein
MCSFERVPLGRRSHTRYRSLHDRATRTAGYRRAGRPDPADPGPPIKVCLDDVLLGDLGNPRVDSCLVRAILLRDGRVADWLRSRGIDAAAVEDAFPGSSLADVLGSR